MRSVTGKSGNLISPQKCIFLNSLLIISALFAGPAARSTPAAIDTLHTIVVLVDFSDAPASRSVEWADNFLNTPGWTDGKNLINVRDYWWEVSRNQCIVINHVFGYYRAPKTRSYYNGLGWTVSVEMMIQALNWVKTNNPNFDWNQISLEKDGRILGLTCIFSASVPGEGGTHYIGDRFSAPNGLKGGQLVGSTFDLFTVLHEYGHMLFNWPDTYNIHGTSGTGRYELMSSNAYWLGVPNASFLTDAGWLNVIDVTGYRKVILQENGNTAVRYRNPIDAKEMFVIEARNTINLSSARIPGAHRGLFIWHIDKNVGGNYDIDISAGQHYGVSLEQADGKFDLENDRNAADNGDAYVPGKSFEVTTTPNSKWWSGKASGLFVYDIQFLADNQISFSVALGEKPLTLARSFSKTADDFGLWFDGPFVRYKIPEHISAGTSSLAIRLYALDGKLIATITDRYAKPGLYSRPLPGREGFPPSVYLCRVDIGDFHTIKQVAVPRR